MIKLYHAFESVIPVYIFLSALVFVIYIVIHKVLGQQMNTTKKRIEFFKYYGLMMSVVGILLLTLLPSNHPEQLTQFVPFKSIIDTWNYATDYAIINALVMNIVLFVPFGFFLVLVIKQPLITVIYACLYSILIEFLQYILPIGRISNIDDIILNTLGGWVGAMIGIICYKLGIIYNMFVK